MYYEEYKNLNKEEIEDIIEKNKLSNGTKDVIICLNTKEKFYSLKEACNFCNLKTTDSMINYLNNPYVCEYCGKHPITKEKLQWAWKSDFEKMTDEQIKNIIDKDIDKKIICLNNKKVFNTLKEASDYYNVLRTGISACCRGVYKSSGTDKEGNKLFWMYYKDYLDKWIWI